ncbi:MAG: glycosyltransferase family 4 protein [Gemmatimonadales bacterium]|nr:glycosyltransferase family 4 protein [Gemmatimonadales bacterium]
MRIVYVTQRLPFGPGETFVIPEIEALLSRGHELLIVPRLSAEPVVHDHVGALVARTRTLPGAFAAAGAVARALVRHPRRTAWAFWRLRRTRPHRRAFSNVVATAQGIWLAGVAGAWGADHIHAHWAHLTATLAMGASDASGIPWSFTAHRYDVVLINLLAEKLRSARFGRFIAREMLDRARPLVGPEAIERAILLHMGVPLSRPPVGDMPVRTAPVVLCPARLAPVKGHSHLLDAAARLMTRGIAFELWLAGDGPEGGAIRRRIDELGLGDRVRILGMVPHAALLRLYSERKVDCVVLPSLDLGGGLHEGISVALIEAMAHGVPTIGTRTGGLPELLHRGAGVLIPPADPDALAAALERVLGSAALRSDLARAGRRRIEEEFDVAEISAELARRFAEETVEPRTRDRPRGWRQRVRTLG